MAGKIRQARLAPGGRAWYNGGTGPIPADGGRGEEGAFEVALAEDFEEGGAFAGGWEPIGTDREPFTGMFNGNGHVVGDYAEGRRAFHFKDL